MILDKLLIVYRYYYYIIYYILDTSYSLFSLFYPLISLYICAYFPLVLRLISSYFRLNFPLIFALFWCCCECRCGVLRVKCWDTRICAIECKAWKKTRLVYHSIVNNICYYVVIMHVGSYSMCFICILNFNYKLIIF